MSSVPLVRSGTFVLVENKQKVGRIRLGRDTITNGESKEQENNKAKKIDLTN
jgi:hypothetical protein